MTESMGMSAFPVTTGFALPGMTTERDLGVAFGLVVRSMGVVKSVGAGFKALRQGEVTQYTQLLEDSRRHAIDRMIENARLLGANPWLRCGSTHPRWAAAHRVLAYGTAVVVTPSA